MPEICFHENYYFKFLCLNTSSRKLTHHSLDKSDVAICIISKSCQVKDVLNLLIVSKYYIFH